MKIVITTQDAAAEQWVNEVVRDGHIGWLCSVECEGTSIKVETIVSFSDEAAP